VAERPVILRQDGKREIYGPAHNSVLQIPDTDEWYIVYHRINKDYIERDKGPGVHREVCIDRMYFNEDGTIQPIKPTLRGVKLGE
jgi:GH43 family beta-xylosidase